MPQRTTGSSGASFQTQLEGVFGRMEREATEEDEGIMGVTDMLRKAGYKPEANTDGEFTALTGQYRCVWLALRPEKSRDSEEINRYHAELEVQETLDGDVGEKRRFFRNYFKDNEDHVRRLCNDAFTCGVHLDLTDDAKFEASFEELIGKEAYIRSWGWTPDTDVQGNPLPEHQRRTIQQFVVKKKSAVKPRARSGEEAPF